MTGAKGFPIIQRIVGRSNKLLHRCKDSRQSCSYVGQSLHVHATGVLPIKRLAIYHAMFLVHVVVVCLCSVISKAQLRSTSEGTILGMICGLVAWLLSHIVDMTFYMTMILHLSQPVG